MNTATLLSPVAPHQTGFSLVEFSIALLVVGLLTWTVSGAYDNSQVLRDREQAFSQGEVLREAVRAFALTHARLPCPDTTGTGWEGDATGTCSLTADAGWLPYMSLGIGRSPSRFLAAYSVYRRFDADTAHDADTAVRKERTGNSAGSTGYKDTRDLIAALANASGDPTSPTRTRLTGNDGTEGAVDCTNNIRSHPAFFIVIPLSDAAGSASGFEGPNGSGSNCAWTPGKGLQQGRDDVVIAEPLLTLSGWLGARAP